jgi:hypothetical protein
VAGKLKRWTKLANLSNISYDSSQLFSLKISKYFLKNTGPHSAERILRFGRVLVTPLKKGRKTGFF